MSHTIALVDDDENILTSLSAALEDEGYRVDTYLDGIEALEGIGRRPVDLAILDIKMPKMDGMELLGHMNESGSPGASVSWRVADLRTEAGQLLTLGLPVIGSQLAHVAMNFVDTVMAGNLSPQALAAVALGSSIWTTTVLFVIGLLMAVTASVSQLFGAGRHEEIGRIVRQALWLGQGLGVMCFVFIRQIDPLFSWLEIEQEIIPTTLGYLDAITWGLPAMCGFIVIRHFSEGVSMTRPVLLISLIGLLTNIGGNYVFMYGRLGLPARSVKPRGSGSTPTPTDPSTASSRRWAAARCPGTRRSSRPTPSSSRSRSRSKIRPTRSSPVSRCRPTS